MKVEPRSFVGDNGRLANDEGTRYARTGGIMFDGKISVRVFAIPPESGQWCHDHSVLEGDRADLDGLEKFGSGHCKVGECFRSLLMAMVPV